MDEQIVIETNANVSFQQPAVAAVERSQPDSTALTTNDPSTIPLTTEQNIVQVEAPALDVVDHRPMTESSMIVEQLIVPITTVPVAIPSTFSSTTATTTLTSSPAVQMQTSFGADNGETFTFTGESIERDGQIYYIIINEHGERSELCCDTQFVHIQTDDSNAVVVNTVNDDNIDSTATKLAEIPTVVTGSTSKTDVDNQQQVLILNSTPEQSNVPTMAIPVPIQSKQSTSNLNNNENFVTKSNDGNIDITSIKLSLNQNNIEKKHDEKTSSIDNIKKTTPQQIQTNDLNQIDEKADHRQEQQKTLTNDENGKSSTTITTSSSNVNISENDKKISLESKSTDKNKTNSLATSKPSTTLNSITTTNPTLTTIEQSTTATITKSPRTAFGRQSNIVWLNLPSEKQTPLKQDITQKKEKLTTTIEIASDNLDDNSFTTISPIKSTSGSRSTPLKASNDFGSSSSSPTIHRINSANIITASTPKSYMTIVQNKKIPENVMGKLNLSATTTVTTNEQTNEQKNQTTTKDPQQIGRIIRSKHDYDKLFVSINEELDGNETKTPLITTNRRTYNRRQTHNQQSTSTSSNQITNEIKKSDKDLHQLPEENNLDNIAIINKKRVTFSEINNCQNVPTTIKVSIDSSTLKPTLAVKANGKTLIQTKFNFQENDRRSHTDFCDYSLNSVKNDNLEPNNKIKQTETVVKIRIQPECRDDWTMMNLYCEYCNFKTICLQMLKFHRKTCVLNEKSDTSTKFASTNSINNNKKIDVPYSRKRKLLTQFNEDNNLVIPNKVPAAESSNKQHDDEDMEDFTGNFDDLEDEDVEEDDEDEEKSLDGYHLNDVVWVETRVGFWPSLIMDILMNEKKLSLRLIDCPLKKESMKTSTKSVISFDKPSVDRFLKESSKGNHKDQLLKTVQKVEDYLRKRCLGTNVNPVTFFNFIEYFQQIQPDANSLTPSETGGPSSLIKKNESSVAQTNAESLGTKPTISKKECLQQVTIDGAGIYQFIKEGHIEAYLLSIHNGADNERHRKFFERKQQNESKVRQEANDQEANNCEEKLRFGPIKDEEQQDDLFLYLSKIYENCLKRSNEKISTELIVPYIYAVWIPEAIIKAISKKHHVDMKKAEELFMKECA